jgi:hypothetical protein
VHWNLEPIVKLIFILDIGHFSIHFPFSTPNLKEIPRKNVDGKELPYAPLYQLQDEGHPTRCVSNDVVSTSFIQFQ